MTNLLINGDFSMSPKFFGWTRINDYWRTAWDNRDQMYQADVNQNWNKKLGQPSGWLYGQEDWLSQVVHITEPHTMVSLTLTEIHHIRQDTVIARRIYGSYDGLEWAIIWELIGVDHIPQATPDNYTHYTNSYQVASDHPFYKLEIYGHYLSVAEEPDRAAPDAYKVGALILEVS